MKIGLLGYGKMGKAIEGIALAQDHQIAFRISSANRADLTTELLRSADVVIEFTRPETAYEHIMFCLNAGVPVVCGTTGWSGQLVSAQDACLEMNGAMLWASNFSIGVNLFFAVNKYLAAMMNQRPEYNPTVQETHHIHKLDAPSGTGLTLVNDLLFAIDRKRDWVLSPTPAGPEAIQVEAVREGEVPGTHVVTWSSAIDEIKLEHKAHSRAGFASGALLAATWLVGKKGVFSMNDVLGIWVLRV
jgi:4-hydroxy-tetrahydrodipicolinate reductase